MQLREVPITSVPEGSNELDEEAEWIYNQAFCKPTISKQETNDRRKPPTTVNKIKQALDFIRNQQLEVPFISFYRKEYVEPELTITDLWKVYRFDAKWCQLLNRRRGLIALYQKMQEYQTAKLMKTPDAPIPSDMRLIKDEDLERLRSVQTPEELKDVHMHFLLYYAHDIQAMQEFSKHQEKEKRKRQKRDARLKAMENAEEGDEIPPEDDEEDDEPVEIQDEDKLKQTLDSGPYAMCRKAGICGLAKHFGLTPEQFAENLRDNYQRHEVDQEILEPAELAKEYVNPKFSTVDDVLHAAKFVVARQIAREPLLRKAVREIFYERAKLNVKPTKKGVKEIDENHACYPIKYLLDKGVREITNEEFLKLWIAEQDKLLTISISEKFEGNTSSSFLEEVKELYKRDEFAKNVQEWNKLRAECVELALTKMVLPDIRKEIQALLLREAKDCVLHACGKKIYDWINIAPYQVNFEEMDDDYDDWDSSKGIRVMGVAYTPDHSQAAFSAILNPEGEVTDYLRTPHILKKKNAHRNDEKAVKLIDLENVTNFIRNKKPHAIVIGGESREALMLQQDMRDVVKQLMEEDQFPQIPVEIMDNELAKIYSNSNKGHADFREYPPLLRQAVSLARRLQDPLVEFSQLCSADEEILCLRYHTLQVFFDQFYLFVVQFQKI
jgi:transcription elongation factor SPT6